MTNKELLLATGLVLVPSQIFAQVDCSGEASRADAAREAIHGTSGCEKAELAVAFDDALIRMYSCFSKMNVLPSMQESNRETLAEIFARREGNIALRDKACAAETESASGDVDRDDDRNSVESTGGRNEQATGESVASCFRWWLEAPSEAGDFADKDLRNVAVRGRNDCSSEVYYRWSACSADEIFYLGGVNLHWSAKGSGINGFDSPYAYEQMGGFTFIEGGQYNFRIEVSLTPVGYSLNCES